MIWINANSVGLLIHSVVFPNYYFLENLYSSFRKELKHSKTGGNSQKQSDIDFKSQVWRKYRWRFLFIHINLSFLIWNISEENFRTIGVLVIENFVFIHITKSTTKPLSLYSSKFAPNLIGFWNHSELLECLPTHIVCKQARSCDCSETPINV